MVWYSSFDMAKKKADGFEKLARLIKEESDDTRSALRTEMGALEKRLTQRIDGIERKMDEGFATIVRRLDQIIQMQLDEHAGRIKKLETAVFTRR